jgi:pilus assembly protein Flp/PilA
MKKISRNSQRGASLVEYALLVALIAVVAIAAVRTLGTTVSAQFATINAQMQGG